MTDDTPIFTPDDDDDTGADTGKVDPPQEGDTGGADGDDADVTDDTTDGDGDDDDFDGERAKEKIRKVNSEARNLRKEKKALEAELAALKGASGDELETLRAENARLKRETSLAARKSIAVKNGLPESFADRLKGEDEDDWQEDAEALAAELKPARKPGRTNNPGASRSESPVKPAPEDLFFAGA